MTTTVGVVTESMELLATIGQLGYQTQHSPKEA
jgi:hypothetical protein